MGSHFTSDEAILEQGKAAARRIYRNALTVAAMAIALAIAIAWAVRFVPATSEWDLSVTHAFMSARMPWLTTLAVGASTLGSTPAVSFLMVFLFVGLSIPTMHLYDPLYKSQSRTHSAHSTRRNRPSLQSLALLGCVLGCAATTWLIKHMFKRPRPEIDWRIGTVEDPYSFPSGHSANNTALWLFLAVIIATNAIMYSSSRLIRRLARLMAVVCVVIPVLIGLSRIYVAHHWATDVLGGWAIGTAWASLMAYVYCRQLLLSLPTTYSFTPSTTNSEAV